MTNENIRYPYREKKHRLNTEFYSGRILVSFTLCVKNWKELFIDEKIFIQFESILLNELAECDCSSYGYRGLGFPGAEDIGNMFQFNHDFNDYFCGASNIDFVKSLNPELKSFSQ